MNARDIMSDSVITISQNESLENARIIMMEEDISALPVTDENAELVGIITQTDLFHLENVFKKGFTSQGMENCKISDVMVRKVITANIDTDLHELGRIMVENQIHRVLISRP